MNCVCGRIWEWEGDDSSEDGTFDDDGSSDDEDLAQAQTALNLIAMNIKASEESTQAAVDTLAAARADVNLAVAPTGESQSPLLLAVRSRHPAAVTALCEHGAQLSPEVLEETRMVSSDAQRKRIEAALAPQAMGNSSMKLPLWAWVQTGSCAAVDALLRNSAHDDVVGCDVVAALKGGQGGDEDRRQMADLVRAHIGEERFQELEISAATRGLLLELRQALDDEREIEVPIVKRMVMLRADVNAREQNDGMDDHVEQGLGLAPLSLLAMNARASASSISESVDALMRAAADVNIDSDEAGPPLLAALRHRNTAAVEMFAQAPGTNFVPEMLDELKTLSEPSRRHKFEDTVRPLLCRGARCRLPLWLWVQEGAASAVEALLQRSEPVDEDVVVALHRCRGDETRQRQIENLLLKQLGRQEFTRLQSAAASLRLLQELREAHDDERDVIVGIVCETLAQGANAMAHEPDRFEDGGSVSALQLLVTNTHTSAECMRQAVAALVEAQADVNLQDEGHTPLVSAMQHRCAAGVDALGKSGAKVTAEVLDELKTVSGTQSREEIEDLLRPLVDKDKSLRCPLWMWIQAGIPCAVEALLRNASYDEDVDEDALVALQRCRGSEESRRQISDRLQEYVGSEDFQRLAAAAATRRLLMEVREALGEKRNLDLAVIRDALACGANPNAREEDIDDEALDDSEDSDDEEDSDSDADGAEMLSSASEEESEPEEEL